MAINDQLGIGCEPFRVWSRLEPRARRVDFDSALMARIHDPMWMLARQWQFGEFKGEDSGSAVMAKMARRTTPIATLQIGGGTDPYRDEVPLEACVEKLPLRFDVTARAQLGRRMLGILDARGEELPAAAQFDAAYYRALFRRTFPITVPALDANEPADAIGVATRRAEGRAHRMLLALAGRAVDGYAIVLAVTDGAAWNRLPADFAADVFPAHSQTVLDALEAYRRWFAGLYVLPANGESAWDSSHLEYQFACSLRRDSDAAIVFGAKEYASGRLDWYAFDHQQSRATPGVPAESVMDVRSVIPTPAEYAGMPNARWWQFEDAAVDLGHIRADSTDVAKIAVAEFALLFGNNWLLIPCRQRVGTLAEIEGIVISDVFGWRTSIAPATGSSGGVWTQWDFFSVSPDGVQAATETLGQHLWLPPTLNHVLESEPVEAAAFVRDEMTNTVWAVETRVADRLGEGRDGSTRVRAFRAALEAIERALGGAAPPEAADEAVLRYRLGTTVAENWIPFVPVHKPHDTRSIRLQRASMPRFFLDTVSPVRPLTTILRASILDDDTQERPYFVNEEEVPRAGIVVEATLQRARWFGGRTCVWYGLRTTSGRGEVESGLRFDVVEPLQKRVQ